MGKKGFRHNATDESIRSHVALPAEQKLEWLEDANRFLYNSMSRSSRKIAEKFRSGEI